MMSLSNRVLSISPSATLQMKAKAKALSDQGKKIVALSAGEPDFETPATIVQAASDALLKGVSRYTATRGTDELIAAMQHKFTRDQKVDYAQSQVMSTLGAKCAISLALDATVGEGDEVIVIAPYWVSYPEQVKLSGATPVIVHTSEKDGYRPDAQAIKSAITPKTKAIILNSPNNPTGAVWGEKELRDIMDILVGTNIWVISDEIYEHLVFDDEKHVSPASFSEDAKKRTIVICGGSKGYAMTGWRVGFAAGSAEIISAMVKLQEQRYTCIPAICQAAAAYALLERPELKTEIERMRKAYESRRDRVMKILESTPNIRCVTPKGAFYALLDVSFLLMNDEEVALRLLSEAEVATVAGSSFGAPGCLRISLAVSMSDIEEGMRRILQWVSK